MNLLRSQSAQIDEYLARLFPINRSLTGQGNRETLQILRELAPIQIKEYQVGQKVYDWIIPDEWSIQDAWIKDQTGNKLVDWNDSNLHVVGYSEPIRTRLGFESLSRKLHYLDKYPEAIPYRTSYYKRDWGFCVTGAQYELLRDAVGELEVCIDSKFDPNGSMTVGELRIPGRLEREYLVSTYICHPSMANDNLSGMITAALLARFILNMGTPEFSWRFIFVPETIGAIAYLKHNAQAMKNLCGGFVVTCCGGPGQLGYKSTFLGDHLVDRAICLAFRDKNITPICYPFMPDGSDERQFSSPGFRIPVATITKSKYYEYSQYHTSKDDLEFVNGSQVLEALELYQRVVEIIDGNQMFCTTMQHGEVCLGSRGLYPQLGGGINQSSMSEKSDSGQSDLVEVILWILFLADGTKDLIDIWERIDCPFDELQHAVSVLLEHQLLRIV